MKNKRINFVITILLIYKNVYLKIKIKKNMSEQKDTEILKDFPTQLKKLKMKYQKL